MLSDCLWLSPQADVLEIDAVLFIHFRALLTVVGLGTDTDTDVLVGKDKH